MEGCSHQNCEDKIRILSSYPALELGRGGLRADPIQAKRVDPIQAKRVDPIQAKRADPIQEVRADPITLGAHAP
jgi:hypothetical protein